MSKTSVMTRPIHLPDPHSKAALPRGSNRVDADGLMDCREQCLESRKIVHQALCNRSVQKIFLQPPAGPGTVERSRSDRDSPAAVSHARVEFPRTRSFFGACGLTVRFAAIEYNFVKLSYELRWSCVGAFRCVRKRQVSAKFETGAACVCECVVSTRLESLDLK